ncbi:L-idonate 5-dehydrogenase [Curtobacterium sp. VKM Ac-2887]|uniref:L-idonate 5-dehydrogenase n=1 Tax=Curtobacterium sp. VKM Ac-2887 TaxID=2783819 RepID=UPI00188DC18E|nr:L-idonate 5-dehydrogenase [Curtobacterium sp. VKM Ac-2887]MBF4588280.1 L-idonate 5-dehydrogenase [Curtobacterium sp. VKM Ac-2887]
MSNGSQRINTAVVVHGKGDLRVEQLPLPLPRANEAVVTVAYGGICGSDLHYWKNGAVGESILRQPMVLGHEIVGTVTTAAADGSGPVAGATVAVHPATIGTAPGRYPSARPNLAPGTTYLGSAAHLPHAQGGFARYTALPTRMLRPLPRKLSLRDAALAEPAAVALHGVRRAGDVAGKCALVIGAGPIGALSVAALRRAGAAEITAVDIQELPLRIAREVGADRTVHATDTETIDAIEADVVIESSGNHHGFASAVRGAARGGTVVLVGLLPTGPQPALVSLATTKELDLRGSFRFVDEISEVLEALADDTLIIGPVATHEFAVENALEAFRTAADASVSGKVLLRF